MSQLLCLMHVRVSRSRHAALEFLLGSRLRVAVVGALILTLWALMFMMFLMAFGFLRSNMEAVSTTLVQYIFAFLFLMLLVLMAISNAIISYISLFRSEETTFLHAQPVPPEIIFSLRSSGSVVFSVWGILVLVFPMVLAYGIIFDVPWYYYAVSLVLSLLFVALATELGAFLALAFELLLERPRLFACLSVPFIVFCEGLRPFFLATVALVLPRRRRTGLILAGAVAGVFIVAHTLPLWSRLSSPHATELGLKRIMDRISFSRHWALPSQWVSRGMLQAGGGNPRAAGVLCLHLLANVLFLPMVTHRMAFHGYRRAWQSVQGTGTSRRYRTSGIIERLLGSLVFFLPRRPRQLVLKDLKTFLRDPSQWSQFVLFFGVLLIYIFNLRTGRWVGMAARWHSLITSVNLAAICLTLATLTSRFVYPQLSLEGRRIWITGLLPMNRGMIIWGKFLFATIGTFLVSAALVALSDIILHLEWWVLVVHVLVVLCVCCGLNGLAVGLGALYPHMDSDNPAKIVSSFGGTLNLILSIVFITVAVAGSVVPLHLNALNRLTGSAFTGWLAGGVTIVMGTSLAACLVPMLAGARAFARMDF
jgi:ABC-2 type transport system permease protein